MQSVADICGFFPLVDLITAAELGGALHWASAEGQLDVVEVLVGGAIDVNTEFPATTSHVGIPYPTIFNGPRTALGLAWEKGHTQIVALLASKGAKMSSSEAIRILQQLEVHGNSLSSIIESNLPETAALGVHFMITYGGADVHERDDTLATPLHYAVLHSQVKVVKMLIIYGADVNAMDVMKRNCLDMSLGEWCVAPNIEIILLLLDAQEVMLDNTDAAGNTLLHKAVSLGLTSLVEALVNKGANTTIANCEGLTAMDLATTGSITELLELGNAMRRSKKPRR